MDYKSLDLRRMNKQGCCRCAKTDNISDNKLENTEMGI